MDVIFIFRKKVFHVNFVCNILSECEHSINIKYSNKQIFTFSFSLYFYAMPPNFFDFKVSCRKNIIQIINLQATQMFSFTKKGIASMEKMRTSQEKKEFVL